MTKLQKRVVSIVAGVGLMVNTVLPVFATTIEIIGNGADSVNTATVGITQTTTVTQDNQADIDNNIDIKANTGGNEAEKNTGGSVTVETGNATVGVDVVNVANSNQAEVACCGLGDVDVLISGNGSGDKGSVNTVKLGLTQETWVDQDNDADIYNGVDAFAGTGKNEAKKNTGGDVKIDTGDADIDIAVSTTANANSAQISGDGTGGTLSAWIKDNGADSINTIDLKLAQTQTVWQDNQADIDNDVDAFAGTGKNEAKKNTGGDVTVETGNANVDVTIDNMANFNWADVDCGGCMLGDLLVKIAGNGYESKNEILAILGDELFIDQGNYATSGELDNDVDVFAKTGDNEADKNTGDPDGDPSVDTGNADATVGVDNSVNFNSYGSEAPSWFPELPGLPEVSFGFDWAIFWAWFHGAFSA